MGFLSGPCRGSVGGSTVAYIFEYLLGIRQTENTVGYTSLVIVPQSVDRFTRMSGSMKTPQGKVAVSYEKDSGKIKFGISIPNGTKAVFRFGDKEIELSQGENEFEIVL